MDKLLGIAFLIIASLTIYDGGLFLFAGIPMQVEGGYRYFYAIPNILIGVYLLLKKKEIKPITYKCLECEEVYCETDLKVNECPKCNGKLMDIKQYYK